MENDVEVRDEFRRVKNHYLLTSDSSFENALIGSILEQLAQAYETSSISWPCFRDLDHDVRDWPMQKTLMEIAALPVCIHESPFDDILA